jgi:hypothetical protein
MIITLILLIISIIVRIFADFIPFVGPIIASSLIPLIVLYGGSFLVTTVIFGLAMFIYVKFAEFLAEVL